MKQSVADRAATLRQHRVVVRMSLFKKPKKPVQLRLFSSEVENMDVDENEKSDADARHSKKKERDRKEKEKSSKPQKSSLLSFGDEGILGFAGRLRSMTH